MLQVFAVIQVMHLPRFSIRIRASFERRAQYWRCIKQHIRRIPSDSMIDDNPFRIALKKKVRRLALVSVA